MKYVIAIYFISVTQICWSDDKFSVIDQDTWKNHSSELMQRIFDREQMQRYIEYKEEQNKLPDDKRSKSLSENQYWLVNKSQDLWLGIFDGKQIKVPGGTYHDITEDRHQPQQVIRIKRGNRISQFLLTRPIQDGFEYPLLCMNKKDSILKDSQDYLLFYSACTFEDLQRNSHRREGYYDILFYSKTYDSLIRLDGFPYSATSGNVDFYSGNVRKIKNYYINDGYEIAFKFIGKDRVVEVDPKTGAEKKPEKVEIMNSHGQWVLGDDPEPFNPDLLKRLPEVVVNN